MSATTTQTSTATRLTATDDTSPSSTVTPAQEQPAEEEELDIYDEIEIEDMTYDPTLRIYHYPCPCGDRFEIGVDAMRDGEDVAVCPGCSLMIRVVFEAGDLVEKKEGG